MPAPAPKTYWFILGRESLIAAAEIGAVLSVKNYKYSSQILKVDGLSLRQPTPVISTRAKRNGEIPLQSVRDPSTAVGMTIKPHDLINRLGGTIKIGEEIADNITEEELKNNIIEELKTVTGKINFGLSFYTAEKIDLRGVKNLGLQIKKSLKASGYSIRYVENKEPALSSVAVEKNGLTNRGREFLIEKRRVSMDGTRHDSAESNKFSLAKTAAVQPFEEFGARDFGRPGRDDVSGMLPPKLAMMMINLAQAPKDGVLLDPFCGSGTIISEALLLGYTNLIGSDISEKAIANSKQNIDWIAKKFQISNNKFQINLQVSNVKNLNKILKPNSIDAIAAEPYLGAPLRGNENQGVLLKQAGELKTLYIEAFKQFAEILKPGGAVVFIIPRFKFKNDWITIDCKKDIEAFGFKSIPFLEKYPHLLYARPNQRVGREIWRFEKK